VIVLDVLVDRNAVNEARNLGVPVVGIVDSNADPSIVDYAIPANDDALKALQMYLDLFVAAVREGAAGKKEPVEKKGE